MKNKSILKISITALFAAIICIGCFLRIPLGPVPIVLQNVLCILCAVLMGSFWGGFPTLLFLAAGLIGLPVYSGGSSGFAVWSGPTGGFLLGYLIGAVLAGFIAGRPDVEEKKLTLKTFLRISIAIIAGMVMIYVPGVIYFARWALAAGKVPSDKSAFGYTIAACVLPYIPGDLIKIVLVVPVALKVRPVLAQYLYSEKANDKNSESEQNV